MQVSEEFTTKRKRVEFLNTIGQSLWSNFRIKLDLVALYSVDSAAVPELIRLASLLQSATQVQAFISGPSGRLNLPMKNRTPSAQSLSL